MAAELDRARDQLTIARARLDGVLDARTHGQAGAADVQRAELDVARALAVVDSLHGWRPSDDLEEPRYSPPGAAA